MMQRTHCCIVVYLAALRNNRGDHNVEGLLISPKQLRCKNLEFLHHQGSLNHCTLDFGDEYGMMSVLKYDSEEAAILQLPYHIPAKKLADAAGVSLPDHISVVGVLPQPCTSGNRQDILKALSLECSSGKEAIRCVNRLDLSLNGSFADMILQEKTPPVRAILFPVVVPMDEPHMTVAKLCLVPMEGHSSKALLEHTSLNLKATLYAGTKWPLTGGISQKLPFSEDDGVERVYIAGYKDGSVQLWNATYSVLSPIVALEGEKIEVSGASSLYQHWIFASSAQVRIYRLCNSEETSFHFVPENNQSFCPVHSLHQVTGLQCIAAFCIPNSPIRSLQYVDSGAELVVGFECGQVAMLDMSSLSVLFLKDCVSGSSSPVISTAFLACTDIFSLLHSSKQKGPKSPKGAADVEQIENKDSVDGQVFILTRDLHVLVLESVTCNTISSWGTQQKKGSTAIFMYIIDNSSLASEASTGEHSEPLSKDSATRSEQLSEDGFTLVGVNPQIEIRSSRESGSSGKRSLDSLVVLCWEDALLYCLKSVIGGE
ncbi:hypothetical protein MKW92_018395 [Papaver armeniacum]|nr:hypothetical protein MKW92_018395 [Papaver armeniacum]